DVFVLLKPLQSSFEKSGRHKQLSAKQMLIFERESVIAENLEAPGRKKRAKAADAGAVESSPGERPHIHGRSPLRIQCANDCQIPRKYSMRSPGKLRSLCTFGLRPSKKNSNTDQKRLIIGRLRSLRRDHTYSTSRGKVHRLRVRTEHVLQHASWPSHNSTNSFGRQQ